MSNASSADREPIEKLAEEFLQRRRNGETPALSEYVARYPDLADEIRAVFPTLLLMEQADPGTSELTRARGEAERPDGVPEQLGDFRILREVGRGGMGVVYEAEQLSLGRRVALKVLPPQALANPHYLSRFEREAKAAARLHHTNIVPVYGVGTDRGIHYYAMQFIHGQALNEVLNELKRLRNEKLAALPPQGRRVESPQVSVAEVARSLLTGPAAPATVDHVAAADANGAAGSTADSAGALAGQSGPAYAQRAYWQSVARVGLQAAEALAYAHGEGILHRDIKPSNLLLDARGHVWVADFGLAKTADSNDLTTTGDIVGTVRYMAPERFDGKTDGRSDVYALGVTLYELAALAPAFPEADRHQLIHQVTTAAPLHLRHAAPTMPRDLRTIVHKAIDREPARRYDSAAALAEDLQRFLDDRPIRARPPGRVELFGRWCRRNPVVVGLLAAVVLVTVVGFALVLMQWSAAVESGARADAAAETANTRLKLIETMYGELDSAQQLTKQQNQQLQASREMLRWRLYIADMRLVPAAWDKENHRPVQQLLERQIPRADEKDLRNFEWYYWQRLGQPATVVNLEPHLPGVSVFFPADAVTYNADGTRLAGFHVLVTQLGFRLWDTQTGRVRAWCAGPFLRGQFVPGKASLESSVPETHVAFSPDGTRMAACFSINAIQRDGDHRNVLCLWDTATGALLRQQREPFSPGTFVAFDPSGATLAACALDPPTKKTIVKLWDTATGKLRMQTAGYDTTPDEHGRRPVAFTADGKRLLAPASERPGAGAAVGRLRVWDAVSGKALPSIAGPAEGALPTALALSSAGNRLAVVWQTLAPPTSGLVHTSAVWLHDPSSGAALSWLPTPGDGGYTRDIRMSPDGQTLVTLSSSGAIRAWDIASQSLMRRLPNPPKTLWGIGCDVRGGVLVADRQGHTKRWDVARPQPLPLGGPANRLFTGPLLSADGKRLIVALQEKPATTANDLLLLGASEIRVMERATGATCLTLHSASPGRFYAFAASADAKRLVVVESDSANKARARATAWDVETGKALASIDLTRYAPYLSRGVLVLSRDASRAALVGDFSLTVWDVPTGRLLLHERPQVTTRFDLSPGGDRVAFYKNKQLQVVDLQTGKQLWQRPQGPLTVSFSPDGQRLALHATAPGDLLKKPQRDIGVLDAATGQPQLQLEADENQAGRVLFSPDGQRLLTVSRQAILWDAVTGEQLLSLGPAPGGSLQFSADGRQLLAITMRKPSAPLSSVMPSGQPVLSSEPPTLLVYANALPSTAGAPVVAPVGKAADAPKYAYSHYTRGLARRNRKDLPEAIAAFRRAIAVDPQFAPAHEALGSALHNSRAYGAAIAALCRVMELVPDHPTARYDAACAAALAAAGRGLDDNKLDDAERSRLRAEALAWLRADLERWRECLVKGTVSDRAEVGRVLQYWQRDSDLAAVRGEAALKRLPAAEQQPWRTLWADVAALLKQADSAASAPH